MESKSEKELKVLTLWSDFVGWSFFVSEKMPKKVRGTVVNRYVNMVLDVLELILEAKYKKEKDKISILEKTNLMIEKIRFLLRISYMQQFISCKYYEQGIEFLIEAGKMVGGWLRHEKNR